MLWRSTKEPTGGEKPIKEVFMRWRILVILLVAFFPVVAFATGSNMLVADDFIVKDSSGAVKSRVITITFTADNATGAIPSLTLSNMTWTDGTNTGTLSDKVDSWFAKMLEIDCNHAGTEPTENSDIYVYQNGVDMLCGNGVGRVDNSDEKEVLFCFAGTAEPYPVYGSLVVTVTQQVTATNSATGTIRIILVRQ
jgi:hypothetical protein